MAASAAVIEAGDEGCGEGDSEGFDGKAAARAAQRRRSAKREGRRVVGGDVGGGESRDPRAFLVSLSFFTNMNSELSPRAMRRDQ